MVIINLVILKKKNTREFNIINKNNNTIIKNFFVEDFGLPMF